MPESVKERIDTGRVLLGSRIRSVRETLGLTLADASASAGISYSYLSDVERGRRLPSLEVLDSVAAALGTSVIDLLRDLYPWDGSSPLSPATPPRDARKRKSADA